MQSYLDQLKTSPPSKTTGENLQTSKTLTQDKMVIYMCNMCSDTICEIYKKKSSNNNKSQNALTFKNRSSTEFDTSVAYVWHPCISEEVLDAFQV